MTGGRRLLPDVDPFVAAGIVVLVATAVAALVAGTPPGDRAVQSTLPVATGLALLLNGLRRPVPPERSDRRLAVAWAGVGTVAFVCIGVWFFVVSETVDTAYWLAVTTSVALGASLGLLVGGYAAQLRSANRTLQARTERLEQFSDIVSHDLRNPLTVARGRLDLAREAESSEDAAAHLDAVEAAHDRIERLTDDLLTLAREGAEVQDPTRLDPGGLAHDAWGTVATGDARLRVTVDRRVIGDPDRVRQLFENLFRNSVEHSSTSPRSSSTREDSHPSVTVTVGGLPDGFFVADDGPGIPAADRERVFERGESGTGGTGIGLAIVASVAEAHGWSVSVAESADGGARFEFRDVERAD